MPVLEGLGFTIAIAYTDQHSCLLFQSKNVSKITSEYNNFKKLFAEETCLIFLLLTFNFL